VQVLRGEAEQKVPREKTCETEANEDDLKKIFCTGGF